MAVPSFDRDIKPYFTPCYRAHMIHYRKFDLWIRDTVKNKFDDIKAEVETGNMPPPKEAPGACPEGGWDDITRAQFLVDFDAWKAGQFLP